MKLLAALGWTTAGTAISQIAALLRLLLVTAVVSAEELGVYAIAASLAAAGGILGDSGLRQLYLSRRGNLVEPDSDVLLSTVWVGIVGASVLTAVATAPLAIIAATYIGNSAIVAMAIAVAACSVVTALQNPALLAREAVSDFGPSMKSEAVGQIASLTIVCLLIREWPSVWLLIIGQALVASGTVLTSYLAASPRSVTDVRLGSLRSLLREGRSFLLISATTYVTASFDKLLLGLMLSPSAAGVFFLAQRLADAPRQLHASILGRTVLPTYASVYEARHGQDLMRATRLYSTVTALAFLTTIIAVLFAPTIFPSASLGQWQALTWLIPLLLVGTGLRAACHVVAPGLIVLGLVNREAKFKLQEALVYLAALPVAILIGGLQGAALAFVSIYAIALLRRRRTLHQACQGRRDN